MRSGEWLVASGEKRRRGSEERFLSAQADRIARATRKEKRRPASLGMTGEGKSVRKENRGKEERVFPV